jgi:hypothetical protein
LSPPGINRIDSGHGQRFPAYSRFHYRGVIIEDSGPGARLPAAITWSSGRAAPPRRSAPVLDAAGE